MTADERETVRVIRDLQARLAQKDRRIMYLQRDKQRALDRARKAETRVLQLEAQRWLERVA